MEASTQPSSSSKRWTELINMCQAMIGYAIDPLGVELAISNVCDPKKGRIINSMISDGKELMAMKTQLEELQIGTSNVKMALRQAIMPGMSGLYDAGLFRLNGMMKRREQMTGLSMLTGFIGATMAEVF